MGHGNISGHSSSEMDLTDSGLKVPPSEKTVVGTEKVGRSILLVSKSGGDSSHPCTMAPTPINGLHMMY